MRYLAFSLLCLTGSATWAASFDCGNAITAVDKAICSHAELSRLDGELAQRFQVVRDSLPPEKAQQLRQSQIHWLRQRNQQCVADTPCLLRAYTNRLAELNDGQAVKTAVGFTHLGKFNDKKYYPYYDALMQDKPIQSALKQLMGPDYRKFKENTARIEISEPLTGPDGILRVYGAVDHAYTVAETALMVKPSGALYVAVLEEGKRILYFTNDKAMAKTLPAEFVKWSERFNHLPVIYKKIPS